jgi:hypothetical protein
MPRPALLVLLVVAAALPALALAAPISTPVPVSATFDRVASRGDFDVEVREGSPASVEIVAEPQWAGRVDVEVSDGELRLSRKRDFDSARGVVVKVVVPSVRALSLSGSGKLDWKGTAAALDVAVSGSGDARLAGKADRLKAAVAGSGDIDAKDCPVRDATVSIAGSGDVAVRLSGGTLTAQIAGSGHVNWWGEGKVGAVATAGSGRVRQRRD